MTKDKTYSDEVVNEFKAFREEKRTLAMLEGEMLNIIKEQRDKLMLDGDALINFIEKEMESTKRKPDYVFQKKLYPSSGVERLYKQQDQILDVAKAILKLQKEGK